MGIPLRKTHTLIDLDAVEHNIRTLRKRAGEEKKVLVLLKADAYGHGSAAVGRLAEELGLFAGGVADLDEVEYLRSRGVKMPLLLLEDLFFDEIAPALERNVKLTVSSLEYAHEVERVAARMNTRAVVHINVDTGMGRLGVQLPEAFDMIREVNGLEHIAIEGIYTHFPTADEKDKEFSFRQIELFTALQSQLESEGVHIDYYHAANSGAVIDFADRAAFDIIRPGVSVFGMFPSEKVEHSLPLRQAMTLKSAFVKVDTFPVGVSIGYGRTFVTRRPSTIGVLPIGYGDGFIRDYSNNAEVLVHGMRAPVVGRVSMDMITVDLTDIPEIVGVGDEAVLLGQQKWQRRIDTISAEELARRSNSITYEVTCLIGKRVPRIFVRGASKIGMEALSGSFLDWGPPEGGS